MSENEKDIDLVIKNSATNQLFWVLFFDFFDKNARNRVNELISQKIIELSLASIPKTLPNGLLLICDRLERRIAKDFQKIDVAPNTIPVYYFIEYEDPDRPFTDNDWIIVDDLKFRGFNFGSMDDILAVLKGRKGKGRYSIEKINPSGEREIIWEGLLFPNELFNKK